MLQENTIAESLQGDPVDDVAASWLASAGAVEGEGVSVVKGRGRKAAAPVESQGAQIEAKVRGLSKAIIKSVVIVSGIEDQPPELSEQLSEAWIPLFLDHPEWLDQAPAVVAGIGTISVGVDLWGQIQEKHEREKKPEIEGVIEAEDGTLKSSLEETF